MKSQLRHSVVLMFCMSATIAAQSSRPADGTPFVGTWRLVTITEGGKPVPVRGAKPTGLMVLDLRGNLTVQIMPDRERPAWREGTEPTPEQAKAAIRGYTSFFGTYTVDEKARTITYHRTGDISPGNVGVALVRHYEFLSNGQLVVTPEDFPDRRIIWELLR